MISIIIPVYNEDESLAILHDEIMDVAKSHSLNLEILFVDDGSKDNIIRHADIRNGSIGIQTVPLNP
ncbi:glycosyltransferase, partial [bacterium]|nr:glycosyltransferase [bacterium]